MPEQNESGNVPSLEVKSVPIDSLQHDPQCPKYHGTENKDAIRNSLRRFGQVEPLVVQKQTRIVIGGNGRLEVMREEGYRMVSIVELDLDDKESRLLSIALNRSGELSEWKPDVLISILNEAKENSVLEFTGFDENRLTELIASLEPVPPPAPSGEPAEPSDPADENKPSDPADEKSGTSGNDDGVFRLVVYLETEEQRERLSEQLKFEGYKCRRVRKDPKDTELDDSEESSSEDS